MKAVFEYKCRYCKEAFTVVRMENYLAAEQRLRAALTTQLCLTCNELPTKQLHICGPGRQGIADLIGYRVEEDGK